MASTSSHFEIVEAAAKGNIEKLKEIRNGVRDKGKFRIMCDSESESDPNFGITVLHAAAGMGELETCKFLVDEVGVYVDVKTHTGETPLLLAVKKAHFNVAMYLIERDAEITMTDSEGLTALHCTILNGEMNTMALLLAKGADIEADSVCGTPLHCAAKSGSANIVKFLLNYEAKPNSYSKFLGISPLISAIYSDTNAFECVDLLLKAKADSKMLANGLSPLAHAIENKSNSCIKRLVEGGADIDAVSSCGLKPIEHAVLVANLEAMKILLSLRPTIFSTTGFHSSFAAKEMRDVYIRNLKQNGDNAWDQKNYSSAIASYTEAIHHKPNDATLYANRGLCWQRLGKGVFALHDAKACIGLKPDWGEAHISEAIAWQILKRYRMSSDAYIKAAEMAPEK